MGERIHRWLAVAAAVIVIAGVAGWRSLHGAGTLRAASVPAPIPSPELAQLIPYSAPIVDTPRILPPARDSITMPRDPFAERPLARVIAAMPDTEHAAAPKVPAEQWRVTTTLMAGTRRAALINDELIYVGDPLPGGGGILTSVERDHVVVKDTKGATHTVAVVKEGNG
jgi:hypothetical protein